MFSHISIVVFVEEPRFFFFCCLWFGEEQTKLIGEEGQLHLDKLDNIACD